MANITQPPHLQIINGSSESDTRRFTLFPKLAPELRLLVWGFALSHNRFIELNIAWPDMYEDMGRERAARGTPFYSTTNEYGRIITGGEYTITVRFKKDRPISQARGVLNSPMLSVNRESRNAALQFYRVRIPCRYEVVEPFIGDRRPFDSRNEDREMLGHAVLYLNPEHDYVYLRPAQDKWRKEKWIMWYPDQALDRFIPIVYAHPLIDFLHDTWANDPRGVGLVNLVLDRHAAKALTTEAEPSQIGPSISHSDPERWIRSFFGILSRLKNVVWLATSRTPIGRMHVEIFKTAGDQEWFQRVRPPDLYRYIDAGYFPGVGDRFNRALPILPDPHFIFDLLDHDPRDCHADYLDPLWTESLRWDSERAPAETRHGWEMYGLLPPLPDMQPSDEPTDTRWKLPEYDDFFQEHKSDDSDLIPKLPVSPQLCQQQPHEWRAKESVLFACEPDQVARFCIKGLVDYNNTEPLIAAANSVQPSRIYDTATATDFLVKEDELWTQRPYSQKTEFTGYLCDNGTDCPLPRPAIGFWLFPVEEALCCSGNTDEGILSKKGELSKPQLGLAFLSS